MYESNNKVSATTKKPDISVIILNTGVCEDFSTTLRSVRCQELQPTEIFILGREVDCSIEKHNTFPQPIFCNFSSDSDWQYEISSVIGGCKSDYIALLYVGDVWHPQKLLFQTTLAESNTELELISCLDLWIEAKRDLNPLRNRADFSRHSLRKLSSLLIRRTAFEYNLTVNRDPLAFLSTEHKDNAEIFNKRLVAYSIDVDPLPIASVFPTRNRITESANSVLELMRYYYRRQYHSQVISNWTNRCNELSLSPIKQSNELVTVVIPAYNAEKTIRLTIDSAITQSHSNVEIIVVNDASIDDTNQIIEKEFGDHPRITVISCENNSGVCHARNTGINIARADFIVCLDADDLLHPDAISVLLSYIVDQPKVAMVYGATLTMHENGLLHRNNEPLLRLTDESDFFQGFLQRNLVGSGSGILFRKSLAQKFAFYDESMRNDGGEGCADWMFYLNISRVGRVVAIPALTVSYRVGPSGMSSQSENMIASHSRLITKAVQLKSDLDRKLVRRCTARYNSRYIVALIRQRRFLRAQFLFLQLIQSDPRHAIKLIHLNLSALFKNSVHSSRKQNSLKADNYLRLHPSWSSNIKRISNDG